MFTFYRIFTLKYFLCGRLLNHCHPWHTKASTNIEFCLIAQGLTEKIPKQMQRSKKMLSSATLHFCKICQTGLRESVNKDVFAV